jgi:hypothetical protein
MKVNKGSPYDAGFVFSHSNSLEDAARGRTSPDADGVHRGHHLVAGDLRRSVESTEPRAARVMRS